jgi:putative transposase
VRRRGVASSASRHGSMAPARTRLILESSAAVLSSRMGWHRRDDSLRVSSNRRSIRLEGYDYARPGTYFVTICTKRGGPVLSHIVGGCIRLTDIGHIVRDCWQAIPHHFSHARLDVFVIMSDHVHGIVVLTRGGQVGAVGRITSGSLGAIIRSVKSATTARINRMLGTPGQQIWQRNYFEHIVRSPAALPRTRWYIVTNPIRSNRPDCL